jgi:hypothetical protein
MLHAQLPGLIDCLQRIQYQCIFEGCDGRYLREDLVAKHICRVH